MQGHVAAESKSLSNVTHPIKEFDAVTKFDGRPRHRRPILVIKGGSKLGKSFLAAQVLRRVASLLAPHDFLEVTVEGSETLDLSGFDHRKHAGVLLDGVGDAYLLWSNREVLQGRPKQAKGAQSATMVYAYAYTLCHRAVVATCDLSALHLEAVENGHWLSNEKNVLLLDLKEKAFQEPAASSAATLPLVESSPVRPAMKRRWVSGSLVGSLPPLPAFPSGR